MRSQKNSLGQPVGLDVPQWKGALAPPREAWGGRFARLEPLDAERHAESLFQAQSLDAEGRNWTYLSYGPPQSLDEYRAMLRDQAAAADPLFFAIIDATTDRAVGVAAYLRIAPEIGSIEIGHLYFSPLMQRTPVATETLYLLLSRAFRELGYRRCEWKCDSLNQPSRDAAVRFGFLYEGLFRQASVSKGRSRDTAWYAILDSEWGALEAAYQSWLALSNFDDHGQQKSSLSALTRAARLAHFP